MKFKLPFAVCLLTTLPLWIACDRENSEEQSIAGVKAETIIGGDGKYFSAYNIASSNGVDTAEAFKSCPSGTVLTGFGASVEGSNVKGVTVHCRSIDSTGNFGSSSSYTYGSSEQEKLLQLLPNLVAVGLSTNVENDNIQHITLFACTWLPDSMKVDTSHCQTITAGEGASNQATLNISDILPDSISADRAVLTGAGLTVTQDSVSAILLRIGILNP